MEGTRPETAHATSARAPEIKVLAIHFGTCEDQNDQSEFIQGVKAFVRMVRAEFERIIFVFSEVLPHQ